MLLQNSGLILVQSLQSIFYGIVSYLPVILIAIIIFVIGWVLANIIGKSVRHLIDITNIDKVVNKTGVNEVFQNAGFKYSTGRVIGGIIKWFLIVVFLVAAFDLLGLSELNAFLQQIILIFLPRVFVAALILLLASVVARAAGRIVAGSAKTAGLHSANAVGSITTWSIWIFALLVALSQLGIATQLVNMIFTAILAMVAIGGGIALGLGGKEHASHIIGNIGKMIAKE